MISELEDVKFGIPGNAVGFNVEVAWMENDGEVGPTAPCFVLLAQPHQGSFGGEPKRLVYFAGKSACQEKMEEKWHHVTSLRRT